jgi:hypothetical protein
MFEARVINLCDCDIATNFGAVAGEIILVDYYAIIFICCDCYFFFLKKKNFCLLRYYSLRQRYCWKQIFLVELGIGLLFSKGKRCSK